MNQKQLSTLIILVVLLGGLSLFLYQRNTRSWKETDRLPGQLLLGEFPLNDVAQLRIQQTNASVNLAKQDDLWRVRERYNYPANFTEISDFIRKAHELKGVQRVTVGASQLSRLDLLPPDKASTNSGTLVEFKDKNGKVLRSLLLGKKHMRASGGGGSPFGGDDAGWPDGRFIKVDDGSPSPSVWVISDPLTSIEPKPESWLSKDFIKVEKLRAISVTHTNATNNWKLARETESGEWKLADKKDQEEVDSGKTSSLNWLLSSASLNDVLAPDTKPETLGLDKPATAILETFDNFVYHFEIGSTTTNENFPVRVTVSANLPQERTPGKDEKKEDKDKLDKEFKEKNDKLKEKLKQEKNLENWTYLVSKWTIDTLLKNRSEFLKEPPKKEEAKPAEAGAPVPAPVPATPSVEPKKTEVLIPGVPESESGPLPPKPAETKPDIGKPEPPKTDPPKTDQLKSEPAKSDSPKPETLTTNQPPVTPVVTSAPTNATPPALTNSIPPAPTNSPSKN